MTKRDYEQVALAIRNAYESVSKGEIRESDLVMLRYGIHVVRSELVKLFMQQNPRFDRTKFVKTSWVDIPVDEESV